jgi:hypothetical protein
MRIGVANNAGCLVTAIEVNLIAPYPSVVSKFYSFGWCSSFTYPSIIHAVMRRGALVQGVVLKNGSLPSISFFASRN